MLRIGFQLLCEIREDCQNHQEVCKNDIYQFSPRNFFKGSVVKTFIKMVTAHSFFVQRWKKMTFFIDILCNSGAVCVLVLLCASKHKVWALEKEREKYRGFSLLHSLKSWRRRYPSSFCQSYDHSSSNVSCFANEAAFHTRFLPVPRLAFLKAAEVEGATRVHQTAAMEAIIPPPFCTSFWGVELGDNDSPWGKKE